MLRVDLAALSGAQERELEIGLREVFSDPMLGAEPIPDAELEVGGQQSERGARRAGAISRLARRARGCERPGACLPAGASCCRTRRRATSSTSAATTSPSWKSAAEGIAATLNATPAETNHAIAERLRRVHGVSVRVSPMEDALRRYEPETRTLTLSEQLPRESRGFHMAFQIILLEARGMVEALLARIAPSTPEAASLIRIGLLNYAAAALLMPYTAFLESARLLRHDMDALAARFCVSFEQACHRLCTLQKAGARGIPFFFLRLDPAGQCQQAILRRRLSVRALWRLLPALGGARRVRHARHAARAGGATAGWRNVPVFRTMHRRRGRGVG